jgi:hypothetical protein
VITAGRPTRTVTVPPGATLGDLAELAGAGEREHATALIGTGELVGAGYVLTPADERVSFIQRLAGAHGTRARGVRAGGRPV